MSDSQKIVLNKVMKKFAYVERRIFLFKCQFGLNSGFRVIVTAMAVQCSRFIWSGPLICEHKYYKSIVSKKVFPEKSFSYFMYRVLTYINIIF